MYQEPFRLQLFRRAMEGGLIQSPMMFAIPMPMCYYWPPQHMPQEAAYPPDRQTHLLSPKPSVRARGAMYETCFFSSLHERVVQESPCSRRGTCPTTEAFIKEMHVTCLCKANRRLSKLDLEFVRCKSSTRPRYKLAFSLKPPLARHGGGQAINSGDLF